MGVESDTSETRRSSGLTISLESMSQDITETKLEFLSRLVILADHYQEEEISAEGLPHLSKLLPEWSFGVTKNGEGWHYLGAQRPVPSIAKSVITNEVYRDGDRRLIIPRPIFSIVSRTAFSGTDLKLMFGTESKITHAMHPEMPFPSSSPDELFRHLPKLKLNNDHKKVLWLAALPNKEISQRLNLPQTKVSALKTAMQDANKLNLEQVVIAGVGEGLVNMNSLPTEEARPITKDERKLLLRFTFSNLSEASRHLPYSPLGIKRLWESIMSKTHTKTREKAFLVALRDNQLSHLAQ